MARARPFTLADRSAGVLLHLTSLPSAPFTGDLGRGAEQFVDWLASARQRWWQMLPVNPIGDGNSPYSTVSSFAGEPLLIGLDPLVKAGWLTKRDLPNAGVGAGTTANYAASAKLRLPLLQQAFAKARAELPKNREFQAFKKRQAFWLRDYSLFMAISKHLGTGDWSTWPKELKLRDKRVLATAAVDLEDDINYLEFIQYVFQTQWTAIKERANTQGVGLIGDLPIFVSHRSADVWAFSSQFLLDKEGKPKVVAGCPPDMFNKDGQLWGNALYDWDAVKASGYDWWLQRLGRMFELFDAVRLDHFIGFHRYWEIDAKAKNARGGKWKPAGGDAFFQAATKKFGAMPVIAEDLGAVIPEVRALRDKYAFPGMKVVQFGFDGSEEASHHKPHLLGTNAAVYTGTHDNPTTRGWVEGLKKAGAKDQKAKAEWQDVMTYTGGREVDVAGRLVRAAMMSRANTAVFPLQDLLGLGGGSRMNTPGVAQGNWRYRTTSKALSKELAHELAEMARVFDRVVKT